MYIGIASSGEYINNIREQKKNKIVYLQANYRKNGRNEIITALPWINITNIQLI